MGTTSKLKKTAGLGLKGMAILSPAFTYKASRDEGKGVGVSLAKAAAEEIFYATPWGTAAFVGSMAKMGADFALEAGRSTAATSSNFYKGQFGGNYNLSQNGYTMRQRGINAIQRSGMNARNALGSEARSFHRGYFSEY